LIRTSLATLALALATTSAAQSPLATATLSPPTAAAARCAALVGDYSDIVDAPTRIVSGKAVAGTAALPSYCDVTAQVKPAIGVGIRLPLEGWNGKTVFVARGGYCRPVEMGQCDTALHKGYACAITDYGHKSNAEQDDVWAHGNLQGQVDCGFRGAHVAAAAMKAVAKRFYGKPSRRAYLTGCSSGGRVALNEAEKFPYDFDGIVAGAAPVSKIASSLTLAWTILALRRPDGGALLSPDDLTFVAGAAKRQCDAADGLVDGVIGHALSCKIDTRKLACAPGQRNQCLAPDQIAGLNKAYAGPSTPGSRAPLPGSELNWIDAFATRAGGPGDVEKSMVAMFRTLGDPVLPIDWKLADFDWSRDYKRASLFSAFNDATNPDLSAFHANGGKLIVYHGLSDAFITPASVIDWFEKVRLLSGPAATDTFARLFLLPGMGHCFGGDGPDRVDLIDAIDAWVDKGHTPDRLVATKQTPGQSAYSRPVYPYPFEAQYDGKGDPARLESFPPVRMR